MMDFEIKIKEELLESKENILSDHCSTQVLKTEQIQDEKCYAVIGITSEVEVKKEPLDFVEVVQDPLKCTEEDPILDQASCGLQENQTLIIDVEAEGSSSNVKSSSGSKLETSAMLEHNINKNFPNLSCKYCNLNITNSDEFKNHIMTHQRKFKCSHCNCEFSNVTKYKRHLQIHSDKKLFQCSECDYETNEKVHLKRHTLKHENAQVFACSKCSFECSQKADLRTHMLTHEKNVVKCSECNYECNPKCLKIHMLKHENKKFKCSECNFETNYRKSFRKHMLRHGKTLKWEGEKLELIF